MQKLLIYFLVAVSSSQWGAKGHIHPFIHSPIQSLILLILLMSIDVLGTILGTKQSHGYYRSIFSRRRKQALNHYSRKYFNMISKVKEDFRVL